MKWIHYCSTLKIPFYIYKLKKEDSILFSSNQKKHQLIIILQGTLFLLKDFTNGEIISIAILSKDNSINIKKGMNHIKPYYYKAMAIETTYLISFEWKNLFSQSKISPTLFKNILRSYQITLDRYELMIHISTHKYIKHRVIQLLLYLYQEFGSIENNQIMIPFEISQVYIAMITGSNKATINKIINQLCKNMLIQYSNNKKMLLTDPLALSYIKHIKKVKS